MSVDVLPGLRAWLGTVIAGIVTRPSSVAVELVGHVGETPVVAITVDEQDIGRLVGVGDENIRLIERLTARYTALRGFRVAIATPQRRGGR